MSNYTDTNDFLKKMEVHMADTPTRLRPELTIARAKHLQEELDEFIQAIEDKDLHAQVDALIDMSYLLLGTANMMGMTQDQWQACWDRVHKANMQKHLVKDKQGEHKLGAVKPKHWVAPDFSHVLGAE